jgi:S-DNA-T family DNA segregation ATPase FtsK/SpoIIIE
MAGVFFLTLAAMTGLALYWPQHTGGLLGRWGELLRAWLGWGGLWVVLGLALIGWRFVTRPLRLDNPPPRWGRVFWLEAAAFASLVLLAALSEVWGGRFGFQPDGGRLGWGLAEVARLGLKPLGVSGAGWMILFFSVITLVALASGSGAWAGFSRWVRRKTQQAAVEAPLSGPAPQAISPLPAVEPARQAVPLPAEKEKKPPAGAAGAAVAVEASQGVEEPYTPQERREELPPFTLLSNEQSNRPDEAALREIADLIETTLGEFNIPAEVTGWQVGPTVTQFAVSPGFLEKENGDAESEANRQKVRVNQILGLKRDLALALSAQRLRIEAPVPGRPYIGIEVPNSRSSVVRLRPLLESEAFHRVKSPLALALGRDVSGAPIVADLAKMPHLLIAGTTGSGKSVCIEAITTCLVMNNTPADLRLVMIDPKMVELVRFNGLPHLFGSVETKLERILVVLRWSVAEMEQRYKLFERYHARNIDAFNRRAQKTGAVPPLPRIVVLIDELADLMMSAPDQTEHNIVRLAQMARATGIHLVVATQRPSTDVVTGLIKANFPARIAFTVASLVDSRVILDSPGAETLLGRGDMLLVTPEATAPLRSQGVMVTDQEVGRVNQFWQRSSADQPALPPPWEEMVEAGDGQSERDGLVEQAIELIRRTGRASPTLLQRRLRIGYPRAARLIDELEEMGIVGPNPGGGREREVLISRDADTEIADENA